MSGFIKLIAGIFLIWSMSSCGNLKELQYLQGEIDTVALRNVNFVEPVIQPNDILGITVYSDNQLASAVYNQGGSGGSNSTATAIAPTGYLVSQDGFIQLHALGRVKVAGMVRKQLGDMLAEEYVKRNLLQNPYVEVRYQSFRITVLGDVAAPGLKIFTTDKVSIFDAISMSGDISIVGKRSNVLLVREKDGVREFARLDLTKPDIFKSPYYFLRQNDMIVVDPTKLKGEQNDIAYRRISVAATLLSIAVVIFSFFR